MTIPKHWVHIYQRPAQGSNFIGRYQAFDYQHTITNMGWFDTASCNIAVQSASIQKFIESVIGSFVAIYVDNPFVPIWEGLINRITFNAGGASYTISLDEMANRVTIVSTGPANAAAETAAVDNTRSQAIYAIKQDQIEFGADPSAATQRSTLSNTILAQRAYPLSSITQAQGQTNTVSLELIGIYHTLEWTKFFTATSGGTVAASTAVINTIGNASSPNGGTFFNNTDTSQIITNAMTIPVQTRGVSHWERLQKTAEAGDASNYWIVGITPTNWNTKQRVLYYRQANFSVNYTTYQRDSLRVRNQYGKIISPWLVVPDQVIRVNDFNIGIPPILATDPRMAYIQQVQYDANSQKVQWVSTDDTTARAAFLLKRVFKPLARQFGAPARIIVT